MRPSILNPMFLPISKLNGIGPKTAPLVTKAIGGDLVRDAALHLPFNLIDRRLFSKIADAPIGQSANFTVTIDAHENAVRNRPYRVIVSDETGFMALVFFNPNPKYIKARLPIGETRIITGEVVEKFGEKQMVHPARILNEGDEELNIAFETIYHNVAGLSQKTLGKICKEAANIMPDMPEWLGADLIAREKWPSFKNALLNAHYPQEKADIEKTSPARRRLAYDEALVRQLNIQIANQSRNKSQAIALIGNGEKCAQLLANLPFTPTGAQKRAFAEITNDMAQTRPMLRLLQGDVGAGKTLVAAYGMVKACEAQVQSAFMAPTEILARQHFQNLEPIFAALNIKAAILTGRDKGVKRREILEALAKGEIQILIGTHALFQDAIEFKNLGFVVIDEQHRFGVNARRALLSKGQMPHMLSMSATPIPRTLAMALYGDMDISVLDEKPQNRIPIQTSLFALEKIGEIEDAVARAIKTGTQIYWVCPLVEESDKLEISAATDRFISLKKRFGDIVEIVHGQMKAADKDAAMARFVANQAKILVATTVIEVGVDVKNANIMVIEHAERFGLAQLHQLRGRVGRGDKPSHCLLLYQNPLSENAKIRMKKLRDTDDGFAIAETDFELRGAGDILGLKQTGLPDFRFIDLLLHKDLMAIARDDARLLLQKDPNLESERAQNLKAAIYIFGFNDNVLGD